MLSKLRANFRRYSRYFWTLLLLGAGVSHFVLADFLVAQMPPYFDTPLFWIYLSGVAELVLAFGLQVRRLQKLSWWLIAAMCTVYLPVHWHVAWECVALGERNGVHHIPCWLGWLRLPVQVVFIWWTALLAMRSHAPQA